MLQASTPAWHGPARPGAAWPGLASRQTPVLRIHVACVTQGLETIDNIQKPSQFKYSKLLLAGTCRPLVIKLRRTYIFFNLSLSALVPNKIINRVCVIVKACCTSPRINNSIRRCLNVETSFGKFSFICSWSSPLSTTTVAINNYYSKFKV